MLSTADNLNIRTIHASEHDDIILNQVKSYLRTRYATNSLIGRRQLQVMRDIRLIAGIDLQSVQVFEYALSAAFMGHVVICVEHYFDSGRDYYIRISRERLVGVHFRSLGVQQSDFNDVIQHTPITPEIKQRFAFQERQAVLAQSALLVQDSLGFNRESEEKHQEQQCCKCGVIFNPNRVYYDACDHSYSSFGYNVQPAATISSNGSNGGNGGPLIQHDIDCDILNTMVDELESMIKPECLEFLNILSPRRPKRAYQYPTQLAHRDYRIKKRRPSARVV
jgi:hypothetical protein